MIRLHLEQIKMAGRDDLALNGKTRPRQGAGLRFPLGVFDRHGLYNRTGQSSNRSKTPSGFYEGTMKNDDEDDLFIRRFTSEADHLTEAAMMQRRGARVLVPDFLPPTGLAVAFGPPKRGGKSSFWLRFLRRFSQGLPVYGHQPDGPRQVTYIATEAQDSLCDRVAALAHLDGPAPRFRSIFKRVDIFHDQDVRELLTALDSDHITIWDSLGALMVGVDENGPEMARYLERISFIGRETGSLQILVHHNTHTNPGRPRGNGSLLGTADVIIQHELLTDGSRTATVTEARDLPPGRRLRYRLQPIHLPASPRAEARTVAVAEEIHEARTVAAVVEETAPAKAAPKSRARK